MSLSVAAVYEASIEYSFRHGLLVPTLAWSEVQEDPVASYEICRWYEAAPASDDNALLAYEALRQEANRQYLFMTRPVESGGLGIEVIFQQDEAYSRVAALLEDICERRTMRVQYSAHCRPQHPFFTDHELDRFRAVHDFFGHAAIEAEFDHHGEEAAWLKHSTMFSPSARRAMATETRAQTAVSLYTFKVGAEYPGYKVVLLPPRFSDPDYEMWR